MTQTGYRLTTMALPALNLEPAHSVPHATAYWKLITEHGNLSFRPDVDVS
jgi:hypothetical protein